MKKSLVVLVLVFAAAAFAQESTQPAAGAAPQQKKEIKDPAEYNAYMTAFNQTDAATKAQALEAFLQRYPNTVIKTDALDLLMKTYQQSGNAPKVIETANRLLAEEPNNVPALTLLTFNKRNQIEQGQNTPENVSSLQQLAQRGLQALPAWTRPEGMADADFTKAKGQLAVLFNAALGFAAMQQKDYKSAQGFLQEAVNADPANLNNVYPLAVAYLEAQPPDPKGLWYVARAAGIAAGSPAEATIARYGRSKYIKYHGGDDGWTDLLAAAKANSAPPAGWAVAPAPTLAEQAAKLAQKPVGDLSFDEIQLVLTSGNQQAADQVWGSLKDKAIKLEGKVISASAAKLVLAGTYDDVQANKPDIELTMAAPVSARILPKEGAMAPVQGTFQSYDANPFMVHMSGGVLLNKSGAPLEDKPAPKRPPVRRPTTRKRQ